MPKDDIRPKGCVEVTCPKCGWSYWIGCLDPSLPDGPFICDKCAGKEILTKCDCPDCNRERKN